MIVVVKVSKCIFFFLKKAPSFVLPLGHAIPNFEPEYSPPKKTEPMGGHDHHHDNHGHHGHSEAEENEIAGPVIFALSLLSIAILVIYFMA